MSEVVEVNEVKVKTKVDKQVDVPDPRFEGINSYGFRDKAGLPIPNAMGYAAIRCIKGHTNFWAEVVAPVLTEYDREELFRMIKTNE